MGGLQPLENTLGPSFNVNDWLLASITDGWPSIPSGLVPLAIDGLIESNLHHSPQFNSDRSVGGCLINPFPQPSFNPLFIDSVGKTGES